MTGAAQSEGLPLARLPAVAPGAPAIIVVPALNEAENIARVIAELLGSHPPSARPLRLVVADGGSTDGTPDIVAGIASDDPRVSLIRNPARIQSAAVNLAVRTAARDAAWLIRADAHADYPPDYVETLIEEAERTSAVSVVVAMATEAKGTFARGVAAAQNSVLGNGGAAHRAGGRSGWVDHGHHALMRIDAFVAVGGYDETFSHNEDAELDIRIRAAGGGIWITGRTAIVYHPRTAMGALWRQYRAFGSGRAATILKHSIRPRLRQTLPLAVAPALLLAASGAAILALGGPGWLALLAMAPGALWGIGCCAYGAALSLRRRDGATLWAGPAAMIMHAAWSVGFFARVIRRPEGSR